MASLPRSVQVDLSVTPFYHCISRCVRRAFLCGDDAYSGKNYDHRKGWFLGLLRMATEVFTIDICAYAVMSNHFHLVVRIDAERASRLTDEAVLRRYSAFFPLVARAVRQLPPARQAERLAVLRDRLANLSWFMRVVNERVAREANKEDDCTGRFWEGRFRSQALLDEASVYTCMSYVDLNPIRAGVSASLEDSEFTSIHQRITTGRARGSVPLVPLRGEAGGPKRAPLDIQIGDYVELLDWSGRAVGSKSAGTIRGEPPALLSALRIDREAWTASMSGPDLAHASTLGAPATMDREAARRGQRWVKGKRQATSLFAE